MRRVFAVVFWSVLCGTCVLAQGGGGRGGGGAGGRQFALSSSDLVTKNVASIGTEEALAAAKSRVLVGTGTLTAGVGYAGKIGGPAEFASQDGMLLLAMVLNSPQYPYEKFAFDGKDLSTGKPNGSTTDLGNFLKANSVIIKRGLFGGVLSSGWPLTRKLEKGEKLDTPSLTKVNGVPMFKVKYSSNDKGDLSITMYFEPRTFRHVMTEYKYDEPPPQSGPIIGNDQKPTYHTLVETFSDFKKVGALVLPMTEEFDLSTVAPDSTTSLKWTVNYAECYFDQALKSEMFKVS